MASIRYPNKPMVKIKGIPMVQRVWKQAIKADIGDVFVACSEEEVFDLITSIGGKAVLTNPDLPSGTDRVYAAYNLIDQNNEYENIINLQGDMPMIDPKDIRSACIPLKHGFNIGTIATNITQNEERNPNITKVKINWRDSDFLGNCIDFYKLSRGELNNVYQHVGIYSFKPQTLKKFISLPISKNEIDRKLEQLRALDAGINIGITFVENVPISIDTKEDLIKIENIIKE
tara:strand:+ start:1583 stop:2275 length:693 start_codon:yes stop_codon:yes gene_type:complete